MLSSEVLPDLSPPTGKAPAKFRLAIHLSTSMQQKRQSGLVEVAVEVVASRCRDTGVAL